jgi:hypothetical protein
MLARTPLFQFLGAIIVLLVTDYMPVAGVIAFMIWVTWIYSAMSKKSYTMVDGQGETATRTPVYGDVA